MAYTKTNWVDGETPITANNLNKIENQLENNTNDIENLIAYSSDEIVIGKWINNKPLYRKTYLIGYYISGSGFDNIQLETDNTINLVKSYGYLILSGFQVGIGTGDVGFGTISHVNMNPSGLLYINRTNGAFGSYEGCRITIEYTKTTDV